jgi:hypothetical protein
MTAERQGAEVIAEVPGAAIRHDPGSTTKRAGKRQSSQASIGIAIRVWSLLSRTA